jgi:hypothetical protein
LQLYVGADPHIEDAGRATLVIAFDAGRRILDALQRIEPQCFAS